MASPNSAENSPEEEVALPSPPLATISLSISSLLSSASPSPSVAALPSKIHIPSQISAISQLSLSSTSPVSSRNPSISKSNAISAFPLSVPFRHVTRRPSEPSNPAAGRRCTVVWFRNDLRVTDNEALTAASNDSLSVLPVYLFDPRDYGKSSSGFDKTGPYRATFLLESVKDLRNSLKSRGSDLVVKIGRPETVLVELVRAVGADALYMHQEVSNDEVKAEERVGKAMEDEGVEVKQFWGSTLYHIEDLPFDLQEMPSNYGGFREKVQNLGVRKTIEALDQIKGIPKKGDVEIGEIPTLSDLGLAPLKSQDYTRTAGNASLIGGESQALEKLKNFASEFRAQSNKEAKNSNQDSIFGANFSCKISPWLATGCLSPRFMFEELKKTTMRTLSSGSGQNKDGTNWLMFELLWRDFFRFITKKYSSRKKVNAEPATACTGALV